MPAFIQKIATSVPDYSYLQDDLRERMKSLIASTDLQRRVIHQIYSNSGIKTRHSILDDFRNEGVPELYFNGHGTLPGTGMRNKLYEKRGRELYIETARKLLQGTDAPSGEITHLITISCTGFYSPGPDYDIIKNLNLNPNIERYNLGFMGCYAAIPGLKMAYQICNSNSKARIMVISNELCTLHFQGGTSTDELISASVFADGAAGVIVSRDKPTSGNHFEIKEFASTIIEEGAGDMAWTIGDTGFNMVLSTYIPELLSSNLDEFLNPVLKQYNLRRSDVDCWAVHPGGRAILDKIEQQLQLPPNTMKYSRKVLSEYGNMSSATILFVLKEILEGGKSKFEQENVFTMAFGPGLTIESGLLVKHSENHSGNTVNQYEFEQEP